MLTAMHRLLLLVAFLLLVGTLLSTSTHEVALATQPTGPKLVHQRTVIGRSVRGRPLIAVEIGDPASPRKTVVVGVIHGNEPAGLAVVHLLEQMRPVRGIDLWIVENMNPDGYAAHTRQNADGVDLNRNFPWHWRPLGLRGSQQYAGPRPLSEPESRAAYAFLLKVEPRIVIWYHQPLDTVDESGGRVALEEQYADLTGLPFRRLTRYTGSSTSWADHRLARTTSFVVELPPGQLSAAAARRHASAVITLTLGAKR
jgi:protein MpaA